MEEHPEIGIISSYIDKFTENWNEPVQTKKLPLTPDKVYKMAKFRNPLNHMAVMMRKDIVIRLGSYHYVPYTEDYELWIRVLLR